MKNIILIANHELTYFYNEIAMGLQKKGLNIFWITPSPKQSNWLTKRYGNNKVLKVDLSTPKNKPIADLTLNELVYQDRVLKYNKRNGILFLESIQNPVYNFIKENDIQFIFGEKTWAHEELIFRIVEEFEELNCSYLSPHTIRIPSGRFAFFEDPNMMHIYNKGVQVVMDDENQSNTISIETPDYLSRNDFLLQKKNSFLGLFFRFWRLITFQNADKGSPCRPKIKITLRNKYREFFARRYYNSLSKRDFKNINKPFVFVTLHMQPEATVDVMGRYYEDQKMNIINLWRKLPKGWLLIVKEHSNAVGCRGKAFFNDLLQLPNVVLVNEKEKSLLYLEKAEAIVSVTGTIGLEALLTDRIALLFGNPHFINYGTCYKITLDEIKNCNTLKELIQAKKVVRQPKKEQFEDYILKNSYEGIISNPISNPLCMSKDNINKVTKAFYSIVLSKSKK